MGESHEPCTVTNLGSLTQKHLQRMYYTMSQILVHHQLLLTANPNPRQSFQSVSQYNVKCNLTGCASMELRTDQRQHVR